MKMKMDACRLRKLYSRSTNCEEYLRSYSNYASELVSRLDYQMVVKVIGCFLKARKRGSTIFFIGNGGSAATASHFAQDLGEVGRKVGTRNFRTISLCDNTPFITALSNDYGYKKIFTAQLSNLFRKGDILVAISASGNSPNVVEAVKLANKLGGTTIGLVGFDGGKLVNLCKSLIQVKTDKGEYGPVEDIHLMIDHMITSYLLWFDLKRKAKKRDKR